MWEGHNAHGELLSMGLVDGTDAEFEVSSLHMVTVLAHEVCLLLTG